MSEWKMVTPSKMKWGMSVRYNDMLIEIRTGMLKPPIKIARRSLQAVNLIPRGWSKYDVEIVGGGTTIATIPKMVNYAAQALQNALLEIIGE
jgi:hypothetical protein